MRNAWFDWIVFSIALAVSMPAASAEPTSCLGFVRGKEQSTDIDRFYADRAVSIMKAGLSSDISALTALVSPRAQYVVWHGDVGFVPRQGRRTQGGVAGAIQLAQHVSPSRFQITTTRPGPISIAALKCEWSVAVLFRNHQATTGVSIIFKFVDGLLVEATGKEVALYEGDVR